MAWDPVTRRLELGSAEYNVTGLRVEQLGRSTAIHVQCSEPLGYRATSPEPGHHRTEDLRGRGQCRRGWGPRPGAACCTAPAPGSTATMRSSRCRWTNWSGRYRTYTADDGRDIVLVLEEEQVSAMPQPVPRGTRKREHRPGPGGRDPRDQRAHRGHRSGPRRPRRGGCGQPGHPGKGCEPGGGPGTADATWSAKAT